MDWVVTMAVGAEIVVAAGTSGAVVVVAAVDEAESGADEFADGVLAPVLAGIVAAGAAVHAQFAAHAGVAATVTVASADAQLLEGLDSDATRVVV